MARRKQLVGFFRELPHGFTAAPSLLDAVNATAHEDEQRIARYLRTGTLICLTMGPGVDFLSPVRKLIDSPSLMTDGVWVWSKDLAYYVETYHVRIPEELMDRMRSCGWTPPIPSEADLEVPALCDCELR